MILERCETPCIENPVNGFWQHIGSILKRIGDTIIRWDQLSVQRRQLREMDDRLLSDIGLSRADVSRIADKRFWDDPLCRGEKIDGRYRSSDHIPRI
jgi:uncharacterized protein YjiS (DUF1127 family)